MYDAFASKRTHTKSTSLPPQSLQRNDEVTKRCVCIECDVDAEYMG